MQERYTRTIKINESRSKSGIIINDKEQFLKKLRSDLTPKCVHCGRQLVNRRVDIKHCDAKCYKRTKMDRVASTNCYWCGSKLVGLRYNVKYCGVVCRRSFNNFKVKVKKQIVDQHVNDSHIHT